MSIARACPRPQACHDLLVVACGSTKAKPPSPARTAACNACVESHKAELEQAGCAAADLKEFCG